MSHESGNVIINFVNRPIVGPVKIKHALYFLGGFAGGWFLF